MRRVVLATVLALASLTPAIAEDDPPFVGKWDCQVGVFTFTADTYDPGDMPMKIATVDKGEGNYVLTMEDGYQVGLSMTSEGMSWLSMETGDSFACTKLE